MMFMPRAHRGDQDARIAQVSSQPAIYPPPPDDALERRPAIVSSTSVAVSSGRSPRGTATTAEPRCSSTTSSGIGSISIRPSRTRNRTRVPGRNCVASRTALGTTRRPALSMVVSMVEKMPFQVPWGKPHAPPETDTTAGRVRWGSRSKKSAISDISGGSRGQRTGSWPSAYQGPFRFVPHSTWRGEHHVKASDRPAGRCSALTATHVVASGGVGPGCRRIRWRIWTLAGEWVRRRARRGQARRKSTATARNVSQRPLRSANPAIQRASPELPVTTTVTPADLG